MQVAVVKIMLVICTGLIQQRQSQWVHLVKEIVRILIAA